MNCIILCGGIGKRLWPLGTKAKPKQFHKLLNQKTLLQETFWRLRSCFPTRKIFISTNHAFISEIKRELPQIPHKNFIQEPAMRDTAAGMGYAALHLSKFAPDEPCAFVPADHFIDDNKKFCSALKLAERLIKKTGHMVDIGVTPLEPLTSLGYTKIGKRIIKSGSLSVYEFLGHTEKPNKNVASRYLNSKKYLWHASYYMWTPAKFLEALQKHAPQIYLNLKSADSFKKINPISFDYAVTEKLDPKQVMIIKANFNWSDVGSWDEVWKIHKKGQNSNVLKGKVLALNSSGNLIFGLNKRKIAVSNIKNLVIIDTPQGLLVCTKAQSQTVKKIAEKLPL